MTLDLFPTFDHTITCGYCTDDSSIVMKDIIGVINVCDEDFKQIKVGTFKCQLLNHIENDIETWDFADGYSQELSSLFQDIMLVDDDGIPELRQKYAQYIGSRLLVISRIQIDEEYRGKGLSKSLIENLETIYNAPMILKPFPLQHEGIEKPNRKEFLACMRKVANAYKKCGFKKEYPKSEYLVKYI